MDQTLTVDISAIADPDGIDQSTLSYQWTTGGSDIAGATGPSHTVAFAELGNTIGVRVSFTDYRSNPETVTSAPTAVVAAAPNRPATGLPAIVGLARAGETLAVDTSGIADADGMNGASFDYQWLVVDGSTGTEIAGATDPTYPLTADDGAKSLKVRVSFTDNRFNPEAVTSAPTARGGLYGGASRRAGGGKCGGWRHRDRGVVAGPPA